MSNISVFLFYTSYLINVYPLRENSVVGLNIMTSYKACSYCSITRKAYTNEKSLPRGHCTGNNITEPMNVIDDNTKGIIHCTETFIKAVEGLCTTYSLCYTMLCECINGYLALEVIISQEMHKHI